MNVQSLLVKNAVIYTPDKVYNPGWLIVDQTGKISAIGDGNYPQLSVIVYDAKGKIILPGFIDIHVHGGLGHNVMDGTMEALAGISSFHASHGTTSFLATTNTQSFTDIKSALNVAAKAVDRELPGAQLVGIHLEGPYINEEKRGAQKREFIRVPTFEEISKILEVANGKLKLVTLAPEIENGLEAVRYFHQHNITVSIGHSNATFNDVKAAIQAGASHTTHHFNGMSSLHHREPGVAGAGMMLPELTVEIICDGHHVHPELIRFLFEVKGPSNICAITDAVFCAGLSDGDYGRIVVEKGLVFLKEGRNLAGSTLTMIQAFRNALKYTGYSIEKLLPAFTLVPARKIKMEEQKGSLEVGKDADFIIVNSQLSIQTTFVKGKKVYEAEEL